MTTTIEENVYNFVRPSSSEFQRQDEDSADKRYRSQFAKSIRNEFKTGRRAHYTMGEAETKRQPPECFLRKGEGFGASIGAGLLRKDSDNSNKILRAQSARTSRDKCPFAKSNKRETVPKVTDHVMTPFRSKRNFVRKNALNAMISEPSVHNNPKFVDSPNGDTQHVKPSGMLPVFSDRKDFGKTPDYLQRMRKEKEEERLKWEAEQKEILRRRESSRLQDGDRLAILEGLRKNWSELNHVFQSLSLLTDTISKRLRKEKIEAQLDELEKFIDLLERHPLIIISDY